MYCALSGISQYFCQNRNQIAKNGQISGQPEPEPDIQYIPSPDEGFRRKAETSINSQLLLIVLE